MAGDAATAVLTLPGEVDLEVSNHYYERASRLITPGITTLVIDMSRTTFIDSAMLALLVRISELAAMDDCAVRLRNPNARAMRILEISGMQDYLPIDFEPAAGERSS
jgi:stage II sporulation protein AA (anti-sigma F factor antagonist)